MSDYGTLINRVLRDLNRTGQGDMTATAQDEIISAIDHYQRETWHFTEKRATLDTVDGQEFYGLPTDFERMDSLVIDVNNYSYRLNERTYDTLEDWFVRSDTYTGYPTDFAVYDEQIRLYPVPNGAYQMTLSYIQDLTQLSTSTDSNAWTTTAEELIRRRACKNIAAGVLHDLDKAQTYDGLERSAYLALRSNTNQRLMTGRTVRRKQ